MYLTQGDGGAPSDHVRQIAHYKNLLVRAQSASSAALHELHTQLHDLQRRFRALQDEHALCDAIQREPDRWVGIESKGSTILAERKGVREVIHRSRKEDRIDLLGVIAEGKFGPDQTERLTHSMPSVRYRRPDTAAGEVQAVQVGHPWKAP